MRHDSRLPRVLHALLHLDGRDGPIPSRVIARMLGTDAAVVRRTMAGLRERGLVTSSKGHRGGWTLARPMSEITLLEVYQALGTPQLFAVGTASDAPLCRLERAANAATGRALERAQVTFTASLAGVTMATLIKTPSAPVPPDADCK